MKLNNTCFPKMLKKNLIEILTSILFLRTQLFGGKVTAALDRQHPRDIFDIRTIMESIDLSEIKNINFGFLLVLFVLVH